MKKFTLLLMAMLAMVGFARADEAQSALTFQWAHSVDGKTSAGDNVVDMCKSSDGFYYVATNFGSVDKDLKFSWKSYTVNFDGEPLLGVDGQAIEGSPYNDGSSYNRNLLLQKVDQQGNVSWNLYTKKGDVDQESVLAATKDGGLVMVVKTRAWVKDAGLDNLLEIVDGTGATTTIKDMNTSDSEYRFLVVRLTAEGKIAWARLFNGLVNYAGTGNFTQNTKNNASVKGLALDDEENIYISGNYRTQLNFKKSDGSVVTLTAKNVSGWTGDSQKSVGDLYLVKLDKQGYYLNRLTSDSPAEAAYMDKIAYANGKIYANGRVAGNGSEFLLGDKKIEATTGHETLYIASINTSDLSVNYANVVKWSSNTSKWGLHNKGLQYIDGALYSTGGVQGSFDLLANPKGMYKAYVIKVNPETGEVQNVVASPTTGISEFFGVVVGQSSMYAFGYDMAQGAILVPYNKLTAEASTPYIVCKYGIATLGSAPILDGDYVVMMNRGGRANSTTAEATFYGTNTKFSNLAAWGVAYYSYKLNDVATGINAAKSDAANGSVSVYTTDGKFLKSASSVAEAKNGLTKGVYVVGNKKVIVE